MRWKKIGISFQFFNVANQAAKTTELKWTPLNGNINMSQSNSLNSHIKIYLDNIMSKFYMFLLTCTGKDLQKVLDKLSIEGTLGEAGARNATIVMSQW